MRDTSGLTQFGSSRKLTVALLALVAILVLAPAAQAAPLPGTTLTNPGDTVFSSLVPPGTPEGTLLDWLMSPYSFMTTAGTTSGSLTSAVFMNPSGTLDFYYQVMNSAGSATAIARETDTSFTGFTTYTGFLVDGSTLMGGHFVDGTIPPVTADRNGVGSVVGFSFQPPDSAKIIPGTTSNVLVISTDATMYTRGNASIIDGGTQTVDAFQPAAIPEPGTLAMLGGGLIALAVARRRRNRA